MQHSLTDTKYNPLAKHITSLNSDNSETQSWFYEAVIGILEDKYLPSFTKADRIAEVFSDLEMKLTYLKEQQQLMQQLRKQLNHAKSNAKVQVAKALKSFGVGKLEGVIVSSITVQPSSQGSKMSLEITDPQELIETTEKPETIRINKRRTKSANNPQLDAA